MLRRVKRLNIYNQTLSLPKIYGKICQIIAQYMVQNPYIWFRTRIYGMQPNIWYMAKYMVYGHMYGPKIAIYMDMAIPQKNPV